MFEIYTILQILNYLSPTFDVLKFLHNSKASGHISIFGLVSSGNGETTES